MEDALTSCDEIDPVIDTMAAPLLADLCHRVRTPLHGILGALELLLDGELSPDARELALVAYQSTAALHSVFEEQVAHIVA